MPLKKDQIQIFSAFGANLMYVCTGLIFATSGYLIPQLEDNDTGFGISAADGSWVGIL